MTPSQAKIYIDSLPVDSDVIVLLPKEMARAKSERDGIISFRLPNSQKALFLHILDRISARIGSSKRESQIEFLLSEVGHVLDNGEA